MLLLRNFLIFSRLYSTANSHVSRPSPVHPSAKPWLFVGLGNPGERYQLTRHNVGFDMIDALAKSVGISMSSVHCKALFGQGLVGDAPILLAKPQTYMNLSGESVGPLAAYYKLPLDRVLVIYDDMDLQCGVLRIQPQGGHAGHTGCGNYTLWLLIVYLTRLINVIRHFRGNREFPRLRIGIGRPPGQMDPRAFVLQKFNATGRERINDALQEGIELLKTLVSKGLDTCASSENTEQKYKYLKGQIVSV